MQQLYERKCLLFNLKQSLRKEDELNGIDKVSPNVSCVT